MRYVVESFKEKMITTAYRIYITDSLKVIGRLDGKRYYDIYTEIGNCENIKNVNPEKDSDEIINNIKDKIKRMR